MPDQPNPIRNDRRKTRHRSKLPAEAVCLLCGKTNPEALRLARRSLLEGHHVVGEANDPDLLVPLCLNCHRLASEGQLSQGVELRRDQRRTLPELVQTVLRALAGFLRLLADSLDRWADRLAAFIAGLDRECPGWRELPEALA